MNLSPIHGIMLMAERQLTLARCLHQDLTSIQEFYWAKAEDLEFYSIKVQVIQSVKAFYA